MTVLSPTAKLTGMLRVAHFLLHTAQGNLIFSGVFVSTVAHTRSEVHTQAHTHMHTVFPCHHESKHSSHTSPMDLDLHSRGAVHRIH